MELQKVEELLARFYEGLTNADEERALREFFATHEVPGQWQADKEFFMHTTQLLHTDIEVPEGLEDRLIQTIDRLEEQECPRTRRLNVWISVASMAAGVAILVSLWFYAEQQASRTKFEDTYSDPQLAYIEARSALMKVSQTLNKGTQPLENLGQMDKQLQTLSSLSSINKGFEQVDRLRKTLKQAE